MILFTIFFSFYSSNLEPKNNCTFLFIFLNAKVNTCGKEKRKKNKFCVANFRQSRTIITKTISNYQKKNN